MSAYVAAGFVASPETWNALSRDWRAALDEEPPLDYFKAREAAHMSGQFAHWTHEDRDTRVGSFLDVILRHQLVLTRIFVPHKRYKRVFKGRVSRKFDNPFWLPTYSAIMVTLRFLAGQGCDAKVEFIFDMVKPREQKLIIDAWDFYRQYAARETKPLIGSQPQFAHDYYKDDSNKDVLPLQAADLHAWHARQWAVARSKGHSYEDPTWRSLLSMGGAEREWTGADLKGVFDMIPRTRTDMHRTLHHLSKGA